MGHFFSLSLVHKWGGVRELQLHVRTQNHGKLPPMVFFIVYVNGRERLGASTV